MVDSPNNSGSTPRRNGVLGLLALLFVGADLLALFTYLGHRSYLVSPVWIFLCVYAVLFCLYVYAAGRIIPASPPKYNKITVAIILGFALAFRLVVLPAPPSLSTDIYRYVWDGRLTDHQINPYRWAPNASMLRWLRDENWDRMEYKAYQTIYMPTSQFIFAGEYALFKENLTGYKAVYTCFDLGIILLMGSLLASTGRRLTLMVWYAWCPLPVIEVSLTGHQDVVGVFFLLLAFVLAARNKPPEAIALALTAAALTKGFALMLMPVFAMMYGRRFIVTSLIALVYLSMPILVYLHDFLHGMQQYLDTVHVNSSLFSLLDTGMRHVTRLHSFIVEKLSDVAILAIVFWSARTRPRDLQDLMRRCFVVLAVILLVVPTLFPWYLSWVLPFMPMLGRRISWAFVLLTGLVAFLYTFYISLSVLWWAPVLEYVPFYIVLAWELYQWKKRDTAEKLGETSTEGAALPSLAGQPETSLPVLSSPPF